MSDPSGYTPRVAIITGSARGIGYSIALRLADDGVDVVINDLAANEAKINEVVEEIKKKGRRSIGIVADVSKEEDVIDLVDKTVKELGSLDVVCDIQDACVLCCYIYGVSLSDDRQRRNCSGITAC